ncbi:MAG: CAP domain-containing protein [Candidatus Binataceae bacterium]
MIAVFIVIFISGFAATEYFINRSLSEKITAADNNESATVLNLEKARDEAKAVLERESAEEGQPLWLRRINHYRGLAKLSPVVEDTSLSHADFLHARYLVEYELRTGSLPFAHTENPSAPYYTAEGLKAAENSDLAEQNGEQISGEQSVDDWVRGPFHRLAILTPGLRQVGLGSYTQSGHEAIGLYLQSSPDAPHWFREPVEFPPPDSIVPLAIYQAGEWPNPLTSCPGYVPPTGLPVTLQLGAWMPIQVTDHSFSQDGEALEHCVFDATSYTNADAATQNWARIGLKGNSAIVLIPRLPLTSGERYSVSITANGRVYAWSFAVHG